MHTFYSIIKNLKINTLLCTTNLNDHRIDETLVIAVSMYNIWLNKFLNNLNYFIDAMFLKFCAMFVGLITGIFGSRDGVGVLEFGPGVP